MAGRLSESFWRYEPGKRPTKAMSTPVVGSHYNVIQIIGAEALEEKLVELGKVVGGKIIRKALREASKVVLAASRARAPVAQFGRRRIRVVGNRAKRALKAVQRPGYMRDSMIVRSGTHNRPGRYAMIQKFDTSRFPDLVVFSKAGKRYFYPAAVEYGHAGPGKAGGTKVTRPNPFLMEGFDASRAEAESVIIKNLTTDIEAAAKV